MMANTSELARRIAVSVTGSAVNYIDGAHPILVAKIQSEIDSFMTTEHTEYLKRKLETADAEIARLENIVAIQQKQIERLMDERDQVLRVPERQTIATELPSGAIVQMECHHEYNEDSTVCKICGA